MYHLLASMLLGYRLAMLDYYATRRFNSLFKRTIAAMFVAAFCCMSSFVAYAAVAPSLTPEFEWSPFQNSSSPATQAGYQLCVFDGAQLVYNTGFIADPAGNTHRYTPGAYTGSDSTSGDTRISQTLAWNRPYHCQIRYRDTAGRWSDWASTAPGAHVDFFTATPASVLADVQDATPDADADFVLPVQVTVPTAWPLGSFGFDVVFDSELMAYAACDTAGTLSAGFNVTATLVASSVLHVQASRGSTPPISGSGTLLRLRFHSRGIAWQSSNCSLTNLSEELVGYPTAAGMVQWYMSGDPNRDGRVTPGDAQRAFEAYLGACALQDLECVAADLDGDGAVTPGDAQDIFGLYLSTPNKTGLPSDEGAPVVPRRGIARSLALAGGQARAGESVSVPVHVAGAVHLTAYGFDVRFDPARLRFVDVVRQGTAGEHWSLVSARLLEPGRLRVGGSAGTGAALEGEGALAVLRFAVDAGAPAGTTPLSLQNPADGLSACALTSPGIQVQASGAQVTPSAPVDTRDFGCFVLDDFGGVHAGGAATRVPLTGGPYFGWNIARAIQVVRGGAAQNPSGLGLAVLDGYGALHTFSAARPQQSFYFYPEPGDRAVDLELCHPGGSDATSYGFFVLDRNGRVWAGGSADPAAAEAACIHPPLDGTTRRAVDLLLADDSGASGWIMDNMGLVYAFGGAEAVAFGVSMQDNWIRLLRVQDQCVRVDASGGMEWSGAPRPDWQLPRVDGDLLVDVEVQAGLGLVALDRLGAIYTCGAAVRPETGEGPAYFGVPVARDLALAVVPAEVKPAYDPNAQTPAPRSYNPLNYAYSLSTGMEMQRIDAALAGLRSAGQALPADLADFVGRAFGRDADELARDSWGEPYRVYQSDDRGYYLVSGGPDRVAGSGDDLWIHHAE